MKRAIIIGAKGQDGRLLTEHLLKNNYLVLGLSRTSTECSDDSHWKPVDILDSEAVAKMIDTFKPDELYYLAAFHHSAENKELINPAALWDKSFQVNVTGLVNALEGIRTKASVAKLFYASSCLIFGRSSPAPQSEQTPYAPGDIYGISKMTAMHLCRHYRNQHKVFATTGILYNHESHLRPEHFVSQKIIQGALRIKRGESTNLQLGDLSAEIDWGYAPNFVEAFHLSLQLEESDDFIIATGETHTVRDFVSNTFSRLGLDWKNYVLEDKAIIRRDRGKLQGDSQKFHKLSGWKPSVAFEEMIGHMLNGAYNEQP